VIPPAVRPFVWGGAGVLLLGGIVIYAERGTAILMELALGAGRFLCM
jgi:hypothetical protein